MTYTYLNKSNKNSFGCFEIDKKDLEQLTSLNQSIHWFSFQVTKFLSILH